MNSDSSNTSSAPKAEQSSITTQFRNLLVVVIAIALSIVLFISSRQQTEQPSLSTLAANSTPLDVALINQKPTLMEFYANWCTSCQAMADDMQSLKDEFGDSVNFVMLNVDNNKWLPEILKFDVDGIPHFVFLDAEGDVLASTIGQQPRSILAENLSTLTAEGTLSNPQVIGQTSTFQPAVKGNNDDPRSHGGLPSSAS